MIEEPESMIEEPEFCTTPDAANKIGISPNHLRTLISTGKAHPSQMIGGTWLFTTEEIERLRNRKRTKGPSKGEGGRPKKDEV